MLGEVSGAHGDTQRLARNLRRLAQGGGAMWSVEMDAFEARLPVLPDTAPAAERLPPKG